LHGRLPCASDGAAKSFPDWSKKRGRRAIELTNSEIRFEGFDLERHSWLGEGEFLRRVPKAELLGNNAKDFEPGVL
jgi:hypothetical protein